MEPQAKIPKLNDNNGQISNGKVVLASQALRIKKLSENAVVPSRGSALSAGYDLSSAYDAVLPARGKALVKTDLSIAIPEGTYARVAPRSGLAWKNSIDVGAGVIDADYRGPVGVILFNHADSDFEIKAGDRIAQLILELIVTPDVVEVDDLDATVRGEACRCVNFMEGVYNSGRQKVIKMSKWTMPGEMKLAREQAEKAAGLPLSAPSQPAVVAPSAFAKPPAPVSPPVSQPGISVAVATTAVPTLPVSSTTTENAKLQ